MTRAKRLVVAAGTLALILGIPASAHAGEADNSKCLIVASAVSVQCVNVGPVIAPVNVGPLTAPVSIGS